MQEQRPLGWGCGAHFALADASVVVMTVPSLCCIFVGCNMGSITPDRVVCVTSHRHNATLHTLKMTENQIGDVGAAAIGEGLRCVPTSRVLASLLLV